MTLVIHGSVGSYQGYQVLREGDEMNFSDYVDEYAVIFQTTEAKVVYLLEEHDVPYEREWGTVVLSDHEAVEYLRLELKPEQQAMFVSSIVGHPSIRIEGHVTNVAEQSIEVDYTYIKGL